MEALHEARDLTKTTFISHVFSTTEDGKAEILNTIQYAILAVIPIVVLNKSIQRFIPEADLDKSSLELLVEIFLQIIIMFCGIIIIHRTITFVPTYSGFKYEAFTLTNAILAFMVLILSIQSKLGIKVNILYDRVLELWNGPEESTKKMVKRAVRFSENNSVSEHFTNTHNTSQADTLDEPQFPPKPISTSRNTNGGIQQQQHQHQSNEGMGYGMYNMGPMPANGVLGGSFGSAF